MHWIRVIVQQKNMSALISEYEKWVVWPVHGTKEHEPRPNMLKFSPFKDDFEWLILFKYNALISDHENTFKIN